MTSLADKSLLSDEAIQADCGIKSNINIILQGLPIEIYALVSQHRVAKDLWEKIKLLMQGTSLTKQERECKLYDEFDKFLQERRVVKRVSSILEIHIATQDIEHLQDATEQFQVKYQVFEHTSDEWSKFRYLMLSCVKTCITTNDGSVHAY
ncbi:hypothetical protein Tco_0121524 [Tanacetum coccineum]